jgi:hypothetical protein
MRTRFMPTIGHAVLVAVLTVGGTAGTTLDGQTTRPGPEGALLHQPAVYKVDTIEFKLAPGEGMEYKYRIEKGGSMVYTWKATGQVEFEMHSEADGAPKGTADSFAVGTADFGHGSFTAPFPGIHGWGWQNKGSQEVTLRLTSAGFYSSGTEFRKGLRRPYELKDVVP